jgi:hypothetical protein
VAGAGGGDALKSTLYDPVDRAIVRTVSHGEGVRAFDPTAASLARTVERPNPRRIPTVRRTGSEGHAEAKDPLAAVQRGRMGRILDGLERCTWIAVVGLAVGHRPWRVKVALRDAGYGMSNRTEDDTLLVLQRYGRERVRRAMLDDPWLRELLDA